MLAVISGKIRMLVVISNEIRKLAVITGKFGMLAVINSKIRMLEFIIGKFACYQCYQFACTVILATHACWEIYY